jgi:nucleoside-diphosphate-sugar epimerase
MQFVYVKDLVRAALKAMDEPTAAGHAFNIANPRPLSQSEAVEAFAKACNKPVKFVRIPREDILRAGGHPMGPKLYFAVYYDMPPITQVTAKAQRVLKFKPTDFVAGLKETYRWHLRHNEFPKPDYEFEDKLLANAPVMIPAKV